MDAPLYASPSAPGGPDSSRADKTRDRAVAKVLVVVLGLNLAVALTKLVVGWLIGAVALVADGVHSLLDGASNIIGLAGILAASRPPDARHPYGHRRFEAMAAIAVGGLILTGFIAIAQTVITRVTGELKLPQVTWFAVAAVVVTIIANLFITTFERREGKRLNSAILKADAGHTLSDALAAIIVLVSFAGSAMGFAWADLVAATLVCAFIGRTGWIVIREALEALTDVAQIDPQRIYQCVLAVPEVIDAHKIRSRGLSSHVHLDLHIHLAPDLRLSEAHAITHKVANRIKADFPYVEDVVIHTEPASAPPDPQRRVASPARNSSA